MEEVVVVVELDHLVDLEDLELLGDQVDQLLQRDQLDRRGLEDPGCLMVLMVLEALVVVEVV
ncbi:hypothetical protein, partial [Salmonella sp. s51933]|uniref:hypothetical protein n=1 Tax=Salmonella sp. s51933 TaxID=3160127 RepID=UPI003754D356